jgi:hypothetical protein
MSDHRDPDDEPAGDDRSGPMPSWPQIIQASNTGRARHRATADRARANRAHPGRFDPAR